jgi:hypothetical protein
MVGLATTTVNFLMPYFGLREPAARSKSRGGWTTKILALTDALGNLLRFIFLVGNRYDTIGVPPLIDEVIYGWRHLIKNFLLELVVRTQSTINPLIASASSEVTGLVSRWIGTSQNKLAQIRILRQSADMLLHEGLIDQHRFT